MAFSYLQIAFDAADVDRLADFWAAALGYERFGSFAQYRSLVDPSGRGPKLIVQQVPEVKAAKNRMHLDIHVADVEGEVLRLIELGAHRIDQAAIQEAGTSWVRMADPDGNEFCLCAE